MFIVYFALAIFLLPFGCSTPPSVEWDFQSFYKPKENPIVHADSSFTFTCPVKDLINWEKKGLAFAKAYDGKFIDQWSKSGSIVTKMEGNKQIAAKLNGKYWMYWGEHFINLAWSDNLIDWTPLLNEDEKLKVIIGSRTNKFDSKLAECGTPALINDEGIVLFYNGKNSDGAGRDKNLPTGTYSLGKVVFDVNNPEKVIFRSDTCLLKPTLPHEMSGQYKSGTVFAEGLVYFQSKWFLYYGTADSYIGVAISK